MRRAAIKITAAKIPEKYLTGMTLVSIAPNGAAAVDEIKRGMAVLTSTIFFR